MDRSPKGLWERRDWAFPKVPTIGQTCSQPPPEAAPRARGQGGLDSRRDASTQPLSLDLPGCSLWVFHELAPCAGQVPTSGAQSYRHSGREPPLSPKAEPGVGG